MAGCLCFVWECACDELRLRRLWRFGRCFCSILDLFVELGMAIGVCDVCVCFCLDMRMHCVCSFGSSVCEDCGVEMFLVKCICRSVFVLFLFLLDLCLHCV